MDWPICQKCDAKGQAPQTQPTRYDVTLGLKGDQLYNVGTTTGVWSEVWCGVCVEANALICDHCDQLIPADDVHGHPDTLCYHCAEDQE